MPTPLTPTNLLLLGVEDNGVWKQVFTQNKDPYVEFNSILFDDIRIDVVFGERSDSPFVWMVERENNNIQLPRQFELIEMLSQLFEILFDKKLIIKSHA